MVEGNREAAAAEVAPPEMAGGVPNWLAQIYGDRAEIAVALGNDAEALDALEKWDAYVDAPTQANQTIMRLQDLACAGAALLRLGSADLLRRAERPFFTPEMVFSGRVLIPRYRGQIALRLGEVDRAGRSSIAGPIDERSGGPGLSRPVCPSSVWLRSPSGAASASRQSSASTARASCSVSTAQSSTSTRCWRRKRSWGRSVVPSERIQRRIDAFARRGRCCRGRHGLDDRSSTRSERTHTRRWQR